VYHRFFFFFFLFPFSSSSFFLFIFWLLLKAVQIPRRQEVLKVLEIEHMQINCRTCTRNNFLKSVRSTCGALFEPWTPWSQFTLLVEHYLNHELPEVSSLYMWSIIWTMNSLKSVHSACRALSKPRTPWSQFILLVEHFLNHELPEVSSFCLWNII
jgi:hypothetical protein